MTDIAHLLTEFNWMPQSLSNIKRSISSIHEFFSDIRFGENPPWGKETAQMHPEQSFRTGQADQLLHNQ